MPTPNKTVLVVDDEYLNRALFSRALHMMGYTPLLAASGAEALAVLGSGIDLVLLDLAMPGLDGYSVARAIRRNPDLQGLPVVVVTSMDGADVRRRAREAGADDFLPKPVDLARLRSCLERFLSSPAQPPEDSAMC